jgi:hypothetical protein
MAISVISEGNRITRRKPKGTWYHPFIERSDHMTNDPNLESPLQRKQEDYWILDMGTAAPYYCKNKIYVIAILLIMSVGR